MYRLPLFDGRPLFRPPYHGQLHEERGAFAGPALGPNTTPVVLDDAVGDGEAQASALADLLGGKEGVEDAAQVLLGQAGAVVAEGETDVAAIDAGTHRKVTLAVGLQHGMLGVGENVEEDLLHLVGIGHGARQLRVQLQVQGDVLQPQIVAPQLQDPLQECVQVHRLFLGLVAAGEREKVLDDLRRPLCLALYGLQLMPRALVQLSR